MPTRNDLVDVLEDLLSNLSTTIALRGFKFEDVAMLSAVKVGVPYAMLV